jgi:hypothetical protein
MEPSPTPTEPVPRARRSWRPASGIGWAEGGRLTIRQRVVPVLALLVLIGTLVYALLPFRVAEVVDCQGALRGAKPRADVPPGAIVGTPRKACRDVGNSRLTTAGVVAVATVVIGVAGLVLPPEPDETDETELEPGPDEAGTA